MLPPEIMVLCPCNFCQTLILAFLVFWSYCRSRQWLSNTDHLFTRPRRPIIS